ncbi:VOC family protein [Halorubrum sp. Atlit-28R]|uniref:VOC family protein n=1 Tax=Halorubrum sp. Atlit-28R TaxID=2282129 RepID=UPI002690C53B
MLSDTPGLHHATGVVGDPGAAADFYGETLGLRLLRRTVNCEDRLQYHLYLCDATGSPSSAFTVFPDPNADPGRIGKPGYETVAFAVPPDSLGYWRDRLADRGVEAATGHATELYLPSRFAEDREVIESQLPRFDDPESGTAEE